jgi:hypothetical protein
VRYAWVSVHSVRVVSTGTGEGSRLVKYYTLAFCFRYYIRCLYHCLPPTISITSHSTITYIRLEDAGDTHIERLHTIKDSAAFQHIDSRLELNILYWGIAKSFHNKHPGSIELARHPGRTQHYIPELQHNGWSRCWPFEAQPHKKQERLQDMQTQAHSL